MKLLKCTQATLTLEVVDLPRHSWKVLPPSKWQVVLTVVVIVVTALVWSLT